MSEFVTPVELRFRQVRIRGKIIENSPFKTRKVGFGFKSDPVMQLPGISAIGSSELMLAPEHDFIEFRFPHRKKKHFAGQFKGDTHGKMRLSAAQSMAKKVTIANTDTLYLTYGKLSTYQKSLFTFDEAMTAKNGLDAGLTLGEGVAAVVAAAGVTVATAPITLGVSLGVAAIAVTASAVKRHMANLKAKQVFVRLSRSAVSMKQGVYFPYEEKKYFSFILPGNSTTFGQIADLLEKYKFGD